MKIHIFHKINVLGVFFLIYWKCFEWKGYKKGSLFKGLPLLSLRTIVFNFYLTINFGLNNDGYRQYETNWARINLSQFCCLCAKVLFSMQKTVTPTYYCVAFAHNCVAYCSTTTDRLFPVNSPLLLSSFTLHYLIFWKICDVKKKEKEFYWSII